MSTMTTQDDPPIDPVLLEGSDVDIDEESGSSASSSGLEDNDEDDAYVDEDDELREVGALDDSGDTRPEEDDEVFNRLAGMVTEQGGGGMSLEDQMILAETEQLEEELPRTRSKKKFNKRRTVHKPSHEVQRLLGQANMAYAQGDDERTISLFLEVIRHDPYVIAAWNTLATVYDEMGNEENARNMRFFAAHVEDEADTWRDLAIEFRALGQLGQCLHCLRKALRKEPDDVAMLFELASIYRQQGQDSKAADAYGRLIRSHKPATFDFNFLSQIHPYLVELKATDVAATAYRSAFDHHLSRLTPDSPESTMRIEHVTALADDFLQTDDLDEALRVVRQGQRWFQGRKGEVQWDAMEDDREYDPPGARRDEGEEEDAEGHPLETGLRHRLALIRLRLGDDDEAMIHVDEILNLDVVQYSDLFLDLGKALIKREMWTKALDCFAAIQECETLEDTPDLIFHIGLCQQNLKEFTAALDAFKYTADNDAENLEARIRMANVLEELGRKAEALEMITEVIKAKAMRSQTAPEASKGRGKSVTKSEKAGQRKLTKRVLEDQMRSTMQSLWTDVQAAEEGIANGEMDALDRFIESAGTMVENFRLAKTNFGKSRGVTRVLKTRKRTAKNDLTSEALALQDRLERAMGFEDEAEEPASRYMVVRQSSFYGLDCEEWLSLIVKYCCVLMVKNEEDVALDILEHVIWSGLFNNHRSEVVLRMTIITCCMRTRAYDKIMENCRRLAQMHQFRHEPFLIGLAALGGGGARAAAAFQNLQFQKFLHRELRIHDDVIKGRKLNYSAVMGRWTTVSRIGLTRTLGDSVEDGTRSPNLNEDDEDDLFPEGEGGDDDQRTGRESMEGEAPKPTKMSPTLYVMYGQHMLGGKAYQSALFYFLRAYEMVPDDPFICLLIAQTYLARAGNRQADNRNNYIVQAMAFLSRYRKLSKKDQKTREEVEYNFGRAFHGIGVVHLAVEHYEKVLQSIETRMSHSDEPETVRANSLAYEAAHNLTLIYGTNGSVQLAKEKSKWLAI